MVANIEHMNNRVAHQLVSAAKVTHTHNSYAVLYHMSEYETIVDLNYPKRHLKLEIDFSGHVIGKTRESPRRSTRMYGSIS